MNDVLCVTADVPVMFAARMIAAFESRPEPAVSIALSDGNAARRCYERQAASVDRIDWSRSASYDSAPCSRSISGSRSTSSIWASAETATPRSLFPHSPALCAGPDRLVVMNHDRLGNNPFLRMTFTFAAIARARLLLFTVEGQETRQAFARVRAGDPTAPATHVRADNIVWIVDAAAAAINR